MAKYKTEPLKCWGKAKELREEVYDRIAKARDEGTMIVAGGTESALALPAGFDMEFLGGEPYGASCTFIGIKDQSKYMKFFEAAEAAKFPRDMCSYMRLGFGSFLCNSYAFGGTYPKPTFNLQTHICDTHGKWYQIMSEMEGVPYNCVDYIPFEWETEHESEESKNLKRTYLKDQMLDVIDWMEEVSGKKFDDEKFINAVNWECESTNLWAQCCMVNRSVPAVMDENMMFSLYVIAVLMRQRKASVEFYKELLDELTDRADRGIAACEEERIRLLHDSQPPWHSLELFRYMQKKYGAVSIGASYSFGLSGGWAFDEKQDTWLPADPPKAAGVELTTREEACEWYANWLLDYHVVLKSLRYSGEGKNKRMHDLIKNWKVDGVVIHLNRGCEGTAVGQMEMRYYFAENNIPSMTYEGNHADRREFDLPRTKAKFDTFMETLGVKEIK